MKFWRHCLAVAVMGAAAICAGVLRASDDPEPGPRVERVANDPRPSIETVDEYGDREFLTGLLQLRMPDDLKSSVGYAAYFHCGGRILRTSFRAIEANHRLGLPADGQWHMVPASVPLSALNQRATYVKFAFAPVEGPETDWAALIALCEEEFKVRYTESAAQAQAWASARLAESDIVADEDRDAVLYDDEQSDVEEDSEIQENARIGDGKMRLVASRRCAEVAVDWEPGRKDIVIYCSDQIYLAYLESLPMTSSRSPRTEEIQPLHTMLSVAYLFESPDRLSVIDVYLEKAEAPAQRD